MLTRLCVACVQEGSVYTNDNIRMYIGQGKDAPSVEHDMGSSEMNEMHKNM